MAKLTDTQLKRSSLKNGIHSDGDRLYLRVQGEGRAWLFIYTDGTKRRRELGLGGYPAVSLANARKKAQAVRDQLGAGIDPINARRDEATVAAANARTLAVVCEEWIVSQESEWTIENARRYRGYVANHLGTTGGMTITAVEVEHIEAIIRKVWRTPTGPYLRSFLERVFDFAMARKYIARGMNPAMFKGNLRHVLPKVKRKHESHAAMPWADVPAFMKMLAARDDVASKVLRLTILTASRQIEIRTLRWCDVREDRLVIPAERYKTRNEHVVPLSSGAKAIIESMRVSGQGSHATGSSNTGLVFSGNVEGRPLAQYTIDRMFGEDKDFTIHGFRSSFATWAVESGGFMDELAQRCLGHIVGNAVSRAYQRSDFFEPKRAALQAWSDFCA